MVIKITIRTPLGDFSGTPIRIPNSEFEDFKKKIGSFWRGGFEMDTIDGEFIVIPPNVLERSIIKIDIIEKDV